MSTPDEPDAENPFEPPQATDVDAAKRRRRTVLIVLGIFLVPLAAVIAGFVTCWAAILPTTALVNGPDYAVPLIAGIVGFLVGAIAAGYGVVRLLREAAKK